MTVTVDDLRSDIEAAFLRAREQLIELGEKLGEDGRARAKLGAQSFNRC